MPVRKRKSKKIEEHMKDRTSESVIDSMTVPFEVHEMEMLENASDIFCRSVCWNRYVRFVQCCVMLMPCSTVKSLNSSVRWEDQGLPSDPTSHPTTS